MAALEACLPPLGALWTVKILPMFREPPLDDGAALWSAEPASGRLGAGAGHALRHSSRVAKLLLLP